MNNAAHALGAFLLLVVTLMTATAIVILAMSAIPRGRPAPEVSTISQVSCYGLKGTYGI